MSDWPTNVPQYVTALPASPYDGQEIFFAADATNGVIWHLRYRAASGSSYKWEFVGGPELDSNPGSAANANVTSTTYVAIASMNTLTCPLAGDYDITIAHRSFHSASGWDIATSYAVGAATALDNDAAWFSAPSADFGQTEGVRTTRKTGIAAATVITPNVRVTQATGRLRMPWMRIRPVRVG